jgi:hypothetical protein
MGVLP